MISWLALRIVQRATDRLNAGDVRPLLRTFRKDAIDRFPGESSWSAEYRGREQIGNFLRRWSPSISCATRTPTFGPFASDFRPPPTAPRGRGIVSACRAGSSLVSWYPCGDRPSAIEPSSSSG